MEQIVSQFWEITSQLYQHLKQDERKVIEYSEMRNMICLCIHMYQFKNPIMHWCGESLDAMFHNLYCRDGSHFYDLKDDFVNLFKLYKQWEKLFIDTHKIKFNLDDY